MQCCPEMAFPPERSLCAPCDLTCTHEWSGSEGTHEDKPAPRSCWDGSNGDRMDPRGWNRAGSREQGKHYISVNC